MNHALAFLLVSAPAIAAGQAPSDKPTLPPKLQGIGIEQKLNATIPLDLTFRDAAGAEGPLRSYFARRPVLLVPVYYSCPLMCNQTLSGVVAGLRPLSLVPGRDFDIVVFSFNPSETPEDAREKLDTYTRRYSRRGDTAGWHFLTGSEASIHALTQAIGFKYRYDPDSGMFVHVAGVMVLTTEGRIARYFYGVEYEPKDLKLGLIEASNGRIGSATDQILLFCYRYDPSTGKYGATVINILRLAGVLSLVVMAVGLAVAWRFDLRRHRAPLGEAHR